MRHKLGVVIVTYNSEKYIDQCLNSIKKEKNLNANIVVVDNNSSDNTLNLLKSHNDVSLIKNKENVGYAKAVNQGLENFNEGFTFIINPDVEFLKDSMNIMYKKISMSNDIGVMGGQQIFPSGKWQRSYGNQIGIIDSLFNLFFITSALNFFNKLIFKINKDFLFQKSVGYVDGGALIVRNESFHGVGGFDERFFFYCEEVDFCVKLKNAGWKTIYDPRAIVMHIRGGSSTKIDEKKYYFLNLLIKSKKIFLKKNKPQLIFNLCKYIEFIHNLKMAYAHRILGLFLVKNTSHDEKYNFFMVAAKTWIK